MCDSGVDYGSPDAGNSGTVAIRILIGLIEGNIMEKLGRSALVDCSDRLVGFERPKVVITDGKCKANTKQVDHVPLPRFAEGVSAYRGRPRHLRATRFFRYKFNSTI